jgi:DNA-binding beta-propeller fold protein YncE
MDREATYACRSSMFERGQDALHRDSEFYDLRIPAVTEINAESGTVLQVLSQDPDGFDGPALIAFDGTHVWVTNSVGDTLIELDASDGSLVDNIQPGPLNLGCSRIAFDGTHLWLANNTTFSVTEYPVT